MHPLAQVSGMRHHLPGNCYPFPQRIGCLLQAFDKTAPERAPPGYGR